MTQHPPPSGTPDASHDLSACSSATVDLQAAVTAPGVRSVAEVGTLIEQSAHDLRSSLNAIQSWAYVLERAVDAAPPPAQRALDGIRSGMQQQLALIEEMEEAVRLLADESPPQWQQLDLLAATEQAITDRRPAAEARGVLLPPVETDGASPGSAYQIDGDMLRLVPLLRHLLVHCIWRAQPGGSVGVHLSHEPDHVKLRITESPPLDRERSATRLNTLSDFFGRRLPGQSSQTSRQSAALLLTRRMIELHGAKPGAESLDGESDKVTICISVRFPRHAVLA